MKKQTKIKSLFEEIKQFQNEKRKYSTVLIVLGILGLIIPVIPGLLFLSLGIGLANPRYGEELIAKIKMKLRKFFTCEK